jgi:hypothetical protein
MATIKSEYYFFNGSEWDLHYFRTSTDMVVGLDSALSNYVGLTGDETISGDKAFTGMVNANVFAVDGGVRKILNPKGGTYTNNSYSIDGTIRIKLPATKSSTSMMRMIVDAYDYGTGESFTVEIGGYMHPNGWSAPTVIFSSTANMDITPKISFGYDENNYGVIYIGDYAASGQWTYGIISVREVLIGYNGDDNVEWNDALQISYATDLGTDVIDKVEDGKGVDAETLGGHLASYFKVEGSAPASHTHDDLYADETHQHVFWEISNTPTTLTGYGITDASLSGHGHSISDVTNLSADLQDKADDQDLQSHKGDTTNPHNVTTPLATSTKIGGIKARLDGTTLYITTDGSDA